MAEHLAGKERGERGERGERRREKERRGERRREEEPVKADSTLKSVPVLDFTGSCFSDGGTLGW
jgi:hypothetical protein